MFKFSGFAGYKDGTFRIVFRDSRKKVIKSVPLDKTDIRNYRSEMKKPEKQRLINKYMKKIIILLLPFLFSGCSCILSQPPKQLLYLDQDCKAVLPDYRSHFKVKNNCVGYTLSQTPFAGYIVTGLNTEVNVIIEAVSKSGKRSDFKFSVIAIDTLKPIIEPDSTMMSYNIAQTEMLYDIADEIILKQLTDTTKKLLVIISKLNEVGLRERVITKVDSLITY